MDGSVAQPRPLLALGLRLGAALALATMAMLVKLANDHGAHLFELIFWRQAITLPIVLAVMWLSGTLANLRTNRLGAHFRRAMLGVTGMCFVYGAVILLPLAEATTISFTAPFFAVMLSVILFREKVGLIRWSAVLLGFAGIAIAMQPGGGSEAISFPGVAVGLIAAFLVALISYQLQDLNRTESPQAIVAWFTGLTIPIAALSLPFVATAHDTQTWLIIGAMGVCGAIGQLLLTASLRYGHAASVIIMDYSSLLWATFYGWAVFDQFPPATLIFGAPLVVAAGLLVAWREHRLGKRRRAAEPLES